MKQMKKKILTVVLAMAMVLATTACGGAKATFEKGSVEGNVYTNASVGIKATMPEGMTVADDATIKALEDASIESAQYTSNLSKEEAEKAMAAVTYDFVGNTANGSSVQIIAEDMRQTIGKTVSESTYLDSTCTQVESTYAAMGLEATIEELGKVQLGGVDFEAVKITFSGIEQGYYVHKVGNTMFAIITTAVDVDVEIVNQFMDSFEAAK